MTESEQYFAEAKQAYNDGNFEKAIELFNKINPQDKTCYSPARFNLALIFQKKGEQDKAIEAYRTISREGSTELHAKAQFNLALIFQKKGELDKTIEAYRTISREDSSEVYAKAQFNLALIFKEKGELDKTIEAYRAISRQDSSEVYANAQFNLARIFKEKGERDKAIEAYRAISRQDSSEVYASAQFNLARIFTEKGEQDKSIEAYCSISREDSTEVYAKAQFNLGMIFSEKGEQDKAIEVYSAISPEDSRDAYAKAQFYLARIFAGKGELDKAKDAYSRVDSDNNLDIRYLAKIEVLILLFKGAEREALDDIYSNVMNILNILHVTFDGDTEDDCKQVAHYTRPSTALKLLGLDNKNENSNFRLSTIHGVNDPTEGRILYNFLNSKDAREQKDNTAFISCFTFNHDSLNQFRLYGKEEGKEASGVSMVFNVKKFFNNSSNEMFISFSNDLINASDIENKQENQINKSNQETYLPLYRCLYMEPVTGYISLAKRTKITFFRENERNSDSRWCKYQKKILEKEKQVQKYLNKIKETLDGLEEKDNIKEAIQYILLPLQYLVKHYAFEEEQECRMISIRSLVQENEKIKTDIAAKSMYVEYPIDVKNAIEKVYLSVGAREYESFFIKALGDSKKVRISDNPFRAKS